MTSQIMITPQDLEDKDLEDNKVFNYIKAIYERIIENTNKQLRDREKHIEEIKTNAVNIINRTLQKLFNKTEYRLYPKDIKLQFKTEREEIIFKIDTLFREIIELELMQRVNDRLKEYIKDKFSIMTIFEDGRDDKIKIVYQRIISPTYQRMTNGPPIPHNIPVMTEDIYNSTLEDHELKFILDSLNNMMGDKNGGKSRMTKQVTKQSSKEKGGESYNKTDRKYNSKCIYVKGKGKTEYVRHKGEYMSVRRYESECKR